MKIIILLLFIGLAFSVNLFAQEETQVDSLLGELQTMSNDTNKVNALNELFMLTWEVQYAKDALDLAKNLEWTKGIIPSKEILGYYYFDKDSTEKVLEYYQICISYYQDTENYKRVAELNKQLGHSFYPNNYHSAIEYFMQSSIIFNQLGDIEEEGKCYNMIGHSYKGLFNYSKALEYYITYLKLAKETGINNDIQLALKNVGTIYEYQNSYEQALEYYLQSSYLAEEMGGIDSTTWVIYYDHVGNIYRKMKNYDSAYKYYMKSLEAYEEQEYGNRTIEGISYAVNIAESYQNLGYLCFEQKQYDEAKEYYLKSLEVYRISNIDNDNWRLLNDIAMVLLKEKDYSQAKKYALHSLTGSKKQDEIRNIRDASEILYQIYVKEGDYKNALEMNVLFIKLRDSLNNIDMYKQSLKQTYAFENENKFLKDSLQKVEQEKLYTANIEVEKAKNIQQEVQLTAQKRQALLLYIGLGIVILFGLFIYNRFRFTQRQNIIIEEQKESVETQKAIIEESHKEITDSINYAKRIQSAILPPNKIVKEYLRDSFILYKPKDVVAGDFYWMEHSDGKVFFAAADCTGHGVPGAMVSVVCNNALNRSVREYGMNTPGDILDKTKELVIKEFEKSEDEVKDGMDIALCCLEGNKLTYAGAHNSLWIVRDQEIIEIKADKQPIGKFEFAKPFTTHEMDLIKGDSLYIFSDGYPDQFGGEKGKKYKTGNLKKLLLSIQNHAMEKQRDLLNDEFEKWRGSIEQIDDVCIIGVRV